jgi:alkylhydroperoxidase family enzyme
MRNLLARGGRDAPIRHVTENFASGCLRWRPGVRPPYFTDAERAALALAEAVTRLSDRPDPVPDEIWDDAARHYDDYQLAAHASPEQTHEAAIAQS